MLVLVGGIHTKVQKKVIYYHDELQDEFSTAQIKAKVIDAGYSYDQDKFSRRIGHFIWYKVIARPLAYLFLKIKFGHRIIGKEKIRTTKGSGYYLYGNHTNPVADALIPSMINYPTDTYVIVHPNNVSMPVLGRITPCLGALPLPDDMGATKNFIQEIKKTVEKKKCVTIYPEAHIWPYYTRIRPFKDTSFRYPVQDKVPAYCFTNTYQKRAFCKTPRIVTYIDGPFFPDYALSVKEQKQALREEVYQAMVRQSQHNTVEMIQYIKAE